MKAHTYHLQLNVSDLAFYKDLFTYLEMRVIDQGPDFIAVDAGGLDLWVFQVEPKYSFHRFHRKGRGINHLAFRVQQKKDVDEFYIKFLMPRGIQSLYDGPKDHPEYQHDYYSVYFEDPDRIKLEVMYKS